MGIKGDAQRMKINSCLLIVLTGLLNVSALACKTGHLSLPDVLSRSEMQDPQKKQTGMTEKDTLIYYRNHVVQKKETLYGLSKQFNVTINELLLINPVLKEGLKKGQIIKIPVKDPRQFANVSSGTLVIQSTVKSEPVRKEEEIPAEVIADRRCDNYTYRGDVVRVAMMLPFYLEETGIISTEDSLAPPEPDTFMAFKFIQFYEGARIALDSLTRTGLNVRLYVYDVAEDVSVVKKIMDGQDFDKMNLIIGPVFKGPFEIAADFARKHHIPIVNPFSRRNDVILDNPWVFKVQPSFYGQMNRMVDYFTTAYPDANFILVLHNRIQDQDTLAFLKENILSRFYRELPAGAGASDSLVAGRRVAEWLYYQEGVSGLKTKLSSDRDNVLLCVSTQRAFVASVMSNLQGLAASYKIIMTGMPEWMDYEMDLDHAMKLNLHLFSPEFVDYSDQQVKQFIIRYRFHYEGEPVPEKHAYEGYDITFYFLRALMEFGTDFTRCLPYMSYQGLQLDFDFHQQGDGGWENENLNIFRFDNYRLMKVK
jgi:hypothetical protein